MFFFSIEEMSVKKKPLEIRNLSDAKRVVCNEIIVGKKASYPFGLRRVIAKIIEACCHL